jgi:hypothetical protein
MPSAHELIQSCTSIFTLPEIYFRVRVVMDDPDSTMEDLAAVLKLDPTISARLLRIVNSPMYGFPKQIDTLTHAVNLLGTQAVSDLVTSTTANASSSKACCATSATSSCIRPSRRGPNLRSSRRTTSTTHSPRWSSPTSDAILLKWVPNSFTHGACLYRLSRPSVTNSAQAKPATVLSMRRSFI